MTLANAPRAERGPQRETDLLWITDCVVGASAPLSPDRITALEWTRIERSLGDGLEWDLMPPGAPPPPP